MRCIRRHSCCYLRFVRRRWRSYYLSEDVAVVAPRTKTLALLRFARRRGCCCLLSIEVGAFVLRPETFTLLLRCVRRRGCHLLFVRRQSQCCASPVDVGAVALSENVGAAVLRPQTSRFCASSKDVCADVLRSKALSLLPLVRRQLALLRSIRKRLRRCASPVDVALLPLRFYASSKDVCADALRSKALSLTIGAIALHPKTFFYVLHCTSLRSTKHNRTNTDEVRNLGRRCFLLALVR